jgi:hypothetical protein
MGHQPPRLGGAQEERLGLALVGLLLLHLITSSQGFGHPALIHRFESEYLLI